MDPDGRIYVSVEQVPYEDEIRLHNYARSQQLAILEQLAQELDDAEREAELLRLQEPL